MRYYFAPMEGITGYVYRRAHVKYFSGLDRYFSPFLAPGPEKALTSREINDILPANNQGVCLIPQILTNRWEDFVRTARLLESYGYQEVNLNLGCPSGTVTAKGKGAGFLEDPDQLDRFLEKVFQNLDLAVSVKTRLGIDEPEEFSDLLRVYNRYPLKEVIIHPRVQKDYYRNNTNLEAFGQGLSESRNPVCYNGDLFETETIERLRNRYPKLEAVMLGRGLLRNPALAREARGGEQLNKEELRKFHEELCEGYEEVMSGDRNVLFKMKELWFYLGENFPDGKKLLKKIKKSQNLKEYREAAEALLDTFEQ